MFSWPYVYVRACLCMQHRPTACAFKRRARAPRYNKLGGTPPQALSLRQLSYFQGEATSRSQYSSTSTAFTAPPSSGTMYYNTRYQVYFVLDHTPITNTIPHPPLPPSLFPAVEGSSRVQKRHTAASFTRCLAITLSPPPLPKKGAAIGSSSPNIQ